MPEFAGSRLSRPPNSACNAAVPCRRNARGDRHRRDIYLGRASPRGRSRRRPHQPLSAMQLRSVDPAQRCSGLSHRLPPSMSAATDSASYGSRAANGGCVRRRHRLVRRSSPASIGAVVVLCLAGVLRISRACLARKRRRSPWWIPRGRSPRPRPRRRARMRVTCAGRRDGQHRRPILRYTPATFGAADSTRYRRVSQTRRPPIASWHGLPAPGRCVEGGCGPSKRRQPGHFRRPRKRLRLLSPRAHPTSPAGKRCFATSPRLPRAPAAPTATGRAAEGSLATHARGDGGMHEGKTSSVESPASKRVGLQYCDGYWGRVATVSERPTARSRPVADGALPNRAVLCGGAFAQVANRATRGWRAPHLAPCSSKHVPIIPGFTDHRATASLLSPDGPLMVAEFAERFAIGACPAFSHARPASRSGSTRQPRRRSGASLPRTDRPPGRHGGRIKHVASLRRYS